MIPLGSTITETTQAVTSCGLFIFIPMMILSVDRQNWRVNGAGNVRGVIASIIVKPAVINGYTLPLSSTITDGHSDGDVECPFCFLRTILRFMTTGDVDYDGQIRRYLTTISDQNRQTVTGNCYRRTPFEGRHG